MESGKPTRPIKSPKSTLHPTVRMKRRLNIGVALILIGFTVAIFSSLVKTSITNASKYQTLANRSQFASMPIHANRGSIYDRNRQILAQSATVFNIILNPLLFQSQCPDKAEIVADKLYEMFKVDKEKFIEKTKITEGGGTEYQIIQRKVEKPDADALMAFCKENKVNSNAIKLETDTKRYYPQGELAASVVGFLDGDGMGQYGLEYSYNEYLSGIDGRIVSAKDGLGEEMPYRYEKTFDAEDGNAIVLTLDVTLQHYLEKNLAEAVQANNPRNRSCGIIMNAKTGAILAMATSPGYDLNDKGAIYSKAKQAELDAMPQTTVAEVDARKAAEATAREQQWKNKAITELYYPGSVFKVVTGSAALEEKVIDMNTAFYCHPMLLPGMSAPFNCWKNNSHGKQNFVASMTNSCNPAFVQIGQLLNVHLFSQYYSAYGFTGRTGIDLPGEAKSSIYYEESQMGQVELASSSFGQTNKVTPIQMITAYAATINGGNLLTPYIVSKVEDKNGNVIKTTQPNIRRQVISEETSAIMRMTLESVVNTNGGGNAYIKGYRIGGKSGTSQKQDDNITQKRDDLYVSSYVGFAPADDPEIIMLVMVDEPTMGAYYGSVVAVPVVSRVFAEALPYLGYYPEYTAEELKDLDVKAPAVEGQSVESAKASLEKVGLAGKAIGNGTSVIAQIPVRGNSIPRDGVVVLYTEEGYKEEFVKAPLLIGKTLEQANKLIADLELNMKVSGAYKRKDALATSQNWQEGAVLSKGTIIDVNFAVMDQTG